MKIAPIKDKSSRKEKHHNSSCTCRKKKKKRKMKIQFQFRFKKLQFVRDRISLNAIPKSEYGKHLLSLNPKLQPPKANI